MEICFPTTEAPFVKKQQFAMMKVSIAAVTLSLICSGSWAFTSLSTGRQSFTSPLKASRLSPLYLQHTTDEQEQADDEIERLKSMAQKLRAEAAALEAERADELSQATEVAFRKFDTNQDGEISFEELKAGLEKALKTELPESRVRKVMEDFDVSGDGALQLDEFVGVDKFRNKLESLARDERFAAQEAAKEAQREADMAKLAQAKLDILNEKEPTASDKIFSVLPYLFPLIDSVQFGTFILLKNQDNPFALLVALAYGLFRSIPFSGIAVFFALSFLSGNPSINRLVRFNMQQAIFLDIALFFPAILGALISLIGGGSVFPPALVELSSDVMFGIALVTIAYSVVSSLLGITPNKIPLISQAVESRMPSIDMFDDQGRFIPRDMREEKKEDDKKD